MLSPTKVLRAGPAPLTLDPLGPQSDFLNSHNCHEPYRRRLVLGGVCHLGANVDDPAAFSAVVLQAFAEFTAPRIEGEVGTKFEYVKVFDPTTGGFTIKPGNIRLNWRKLFEKTPELILTGAGVTQPWLVPFAALYAWNLVWSLAKIDITPAQAMAMHALWNAGQKSRRFTEPEALSIVNAFRKTCREAPQSEAQFAKVVDDLVALDCVELTDGKIWLREWVKKAN